MTNNSLDHSLDLNRANAQPQGNHQNSAERQTADLNFGTSDAGTTNFAQTNLVDLMLADRAPAQTVPARTASDAPTPAPATPGDATNKPCPDSQTYQRYVDFIAQRIYDPASMGDLNKLRTKYNCEIASGGDPFKYAKEAFDNDDDPYTGILTPDQFNKMLEQQNGTDVGAGVVLRMPTAAEQVSGTPQPLIVQEFESTPNRKEELKPGDEILAVDNKSVKGKNWRDALSFFDGKENSEFDVKVLRDGTETTVRLKRTKEELPAVTSKTVDGGNFAHIRLRTFMQSDTSQELEQAILANPNAKGYILDLRHNPGGLLNQAFTSASVFMKEGDVLTVKSRVPSDPSQPQHKTETYSLSKDYITKMQNGGQPENFMLRHPDRVDKPVVVLTDQGTASAAEILAGALKDSDGAYVIGTPTWGKGIGQSIMSDWESGGGIKMTTFHYFTPRGNWPGDGHHNRIGLQPNQFVPNPAPQYYGTAQDGQLNEAIKYLRNKTAIDNTLPFQRK
jgi:C-terminal peptidase prc